MEEYAGGGKRQKKREENHDQAFIQQFKKQSSSELRNTTVIMTKHGENCILVKSLFFLSFPRLISYITNLRVPHARRNVCKCENNGFLQHKSHSIPHRENKSTSRNDIKLTPRAKNNKKNDSA